MANMRYRLALDLGTTSLGWAMIRLDQHDQPCAIIKAGVRIFNDGRNPKDGTSLAVTRRAARAMRRRRDRLLKRKSRLTETLIALGFFPANLEERKALQLVNPYALRAKGLDQALLPAEFARALFHINQRRGFKSNRKTDQAETDSGALKSAISALRKQLIETNCRTVGEYLFQRDQAGLTVRARYREQRIARVDGKTRIEKSYDLYIDRAMIEAEFDCLWHAQSSFNSTLFTENARLQLKHCLLHQRPLKPVRPGRCTFMPEEERAPLALPSQQRFRMYQEVNNLRVLRYGLKEEALSLDQRDTIIDALERNSKRTFFELKKLIGLKGSDSFNLEDIKRKELKGNATSASLSKIENFGNAWWDFNSELQDEIVTRLAQEENEARLIQWLVQETGVSSDTAERIANAGLPEGYGSLSQKALQRILPALKASVCHYADAAKNAGFHHSQIDLLTEIPGKTFPLEIIDKETGEIKALHAFKALPYYGEVLQRHVSFGTGSSQDTPEKRFGKIANPTVHIGLNQVRVVVNALLKRYGHPDQIVVELARDLKQSRDQRLETQKRQAENQKRNMRIRKEIGAIFAISPESVSAHDVQKMVLWEELSNDAANRRCPYSGTLISVAMLLSNQIEIEHILPFSQTLDDGLNNKTVATRLANRVKGNRTPWNARHHFEAQGWSFDAILDRAKQMTATKRDRFGEDGYQKWLRDEKSFLARALNDTRYLSRVATEYLRLICPTDTRVIPGQLTAMLRGKFGLNDVLGLHGEKNRNDHRHHAVDACVIGVTDQGMLQRFAAASASAREQQLDRMVAKMPMPWGTDQDRHYFNSVQRAIKYIWVSHKPDHGYEGAMHEETAWGLRPNGQSTRRVKGADGIRHRETKNRTVIPITSSRDKVRHGYDENGQPKAYKGYVGGSNYCIEIVRTESGKWEGEIISTFAAYQVIRKFGAIQGLSKLRSPKISLSGKPLVMRLQNGDLVRLESDKGLQTLRVVKMGSNGQIFFASHQEANVDARNSQTDDPFVYISKTAGTLRKAQGRRVTVNPVGQLRDPGFQG